jgi:excisionase family DNA binding protein
MSEPASKQAADAKGGLLTLSEVSNRTKISMPTLQRYKKEYQSRIPSVGKGRKQRYPEASLAVFQEIKKENIGRRGRPRKDPNATRAVAGKRRGRKPKAAEAAARGRKPAAAKAARRGRPKKAVAATGGLLTLTEISKRTGISYPTLVRYVKLYSRKLPHEGSGRKRRFYPAAVDVFSELRQQSGRGRRPGRKPAAGGTRAVKRGRPAAAVAAGGDGGFAKRVKSLEKSQASLEKQIQTLIKQLQKPLKVTIARGR